LLRDLLARPVPGYGTRRSARIAQGVAWNNMGWLCEAGQHHSDVDIGCILNG